MLEKQEVSNWAEDLKFEKGENYLKQEYNSLGSGCDSVGGAGAFDTKIHGLNPVIGKIYLLFKTVL